MDKRVDSRLSDKHITTNYMKEFQCIGGECSDNCCTSSWTISIDKPTYYKYKAIDDPALRSKLDASIKKFKGDRSSEKFGYIVPQNGKRCVFQSDCGLCEIHSDLGEDALSKTCRTYPKRVKKFQNASFLTGMTSCPEVTRLCLENPIKPIEVNAEANLSPKLAIGKTTSDCEVELLLQTVDAIDESNLHPAMQVIFLMQLVKWFQTNASVPSEIELKIFSDQLLLKIASLGSSIDPMDAAIFQYSFFDRVVLERNYNANAKEPIAILIKNIANGLMYRSVAKANSIALYLNGKNTVLFDFESKNPGLFSRLLINEIYGNAELFIHGNSAADAILRKIVARMAFTRFMLSGCANAMGVEFAMDDYIKCVYLTARSLEHDPKKSDTLESALKQRGGDPLIASALLLV